MFSLQPNMPKGSSNPTFTPSFFFFLSLLIFLTFPGRTRSDYTCAYPCYPPPTGGGTSTTPTTPSATLPPPPPPPQSGATYQPPSGNGNYPYIPSPPYGGEGGGGNGGFNGYGRPPPPDPILPYFPFYYRKPPHMTEENSAATNVNQWTGMITTTSLFSLMFLFFII